MERKRRTRRIRGNDSAGRNLPAKAAPKCRSKWNGEIIYVFRCACVDCMLNPYVYDDADRERVMRAIKEMTKEIRIDKSYVNFSGTKYRNTFLTEGGWNALRELVTDTGFGAKCTETQKSMMDRAYRSMLVSYIEHVFGLMGWDTDAMSFSVAENTSFIVEYVPDTIEEWKHYRGKWQERGDVPSPGE